MSDNPFEEENKLFWISWKLENKLNQFYSTDRDDDDAILELIRGNPNGARTKRDFTNPDPNTVYPLSQAVALHLSLAVVKALYDAFPEAIEEEDNKYGNTPLHHVFKYGRGVPLELVLFLVDEYPAALEVRNKSGCTPLHLACEGRNAQPDVVTALVKRYPDALQIMTSRGTPLHRACYTGAPADVVEILAKQYPAAVEMKDVMGRTVLHRACTGGSAKADVVAALLKYCPAALDMKCVTGNSYQEPMVPVQWAISYHAPVEVIRVLVERHPASMGVETASGLSLSCLATANRSSKEVFQLLTTFGTLLNSGCNDEKVTNMLLCPGRGRELWATTVAPTLYWRSSVVQTLGIYPNLMPTLLGRVGQDQRIQTMYGIVRETMSLFSNIG